MRRFSVQTTIIIFAILSCTPLFSFSVSAGGNLWYNWWQPAWRDANYRFYSTYYMSPNPWSQYEWDMPDVNRDSGFLYGPALSIRFLDSFSISTVFMYGKFNYSSAGNTNITITEIGNGTVHNTTDECEMDISIKRWDSDTVLSYNLKDNYFLLVGFKAQGYTYEETLKEMGFSFSTKTRIANYGPGLGLGVSLPLIDHFSLFGSVTTLVMKGSEKIQSGSASGGQVVEFKNGSFYAYGGTAALALSYFIEGVTLSTGFRYQILRYIQDESDRGFVAFDGRMDQYYGITFSALYTVSFDN